MRINLSEKAQRQMYGAKTATDTEDPRRRERLAREAEAQAIKQRTAATREAAIQSDRSLAAAISTLEEAEAKLRSAKSNDVLHIAKNDVAEAAERKKQLEELLAQATARLERASAHLATLALEFDTTANQASRDQALVAATNAASACDAAWNEVPKNLRKEKRDRKLRRRARELGLTRDVTKTHEED
jgi:hypothetical protein